MIINSITLDNFKSHKHTHIDFEEGISLILGSNGAGKSSIFEAISYALFKEFDGTKDKITRKPIDEDDIVKKMKVTLEFTHNSNHYKLIRENDGGAKAQLYINNDDEFSILSDTDTEVTSELKSILGLDNQSFKNAVYIKQGEITDLIDKNPSEKKELIGKLLNIDTVEKAWKELKNIIDIYEHQISENKGKLSIKDEIIEKISLLEEIIKENESLLDEEEPKVKTLKKELEVLLEIIEVSDKNKNEFNNLSNNLEQQKKLIDHLKTQKIKTENKLKEIEGYEKECVELEKYVKKLPHYEKLKDYQLELNKYKIKLEHSNENITKINNYKKIIEENKEYYDKYLAIDKELEELSSNRKSLEEKVKNNQTITILLDERKNKKKSNVEYIRDISGYASKIFNENFNSPEEVERKVIDETTKTNNSIDVLEKKIIKNNQELSIKRNELETTRKSLNDLENTQDTCPICQSSISHEKHEALSQKYKDDINNFELRIEELETANKNQEVKVNESKDYLEKIEKIDINKLKDQYLEFNDLKEEIQELEKKIPEIEKDNKDLEELDEKIIETKKYQSNIKDKYNDYLISSSNIEKFNIDSEEKNHKDLSDKIQDLKYQCRAIMQKYAVKDDLDKTIEYAQEKVKRYEKYQGLIEEKEKYLHEKEDSIKNIMSEEKTFKENEEKINNLGYDDEENRKLHDTYTSQQEEYENKEKNITEMKIIIKKDNQSLCENKEELKTLEKVSKEQDNLEDFLKLLKDIRELYNKDGIQKILRDGARPMIEEETMNIFSDFDFDYTSLKLNENYDVTIENKNGELSSDMISGGEKIAVALALRLGIARVISKNKSELLLLDEPTIHLDSEKRDRLIEIIAENSIVPQMIVVTHDDGMEALSNNIIKIRKENGISFVDNS